MDSFPPSNNLSTGSQADINHFLTTLTYFRIIDFKIGFFVRKFYTIAALCALTSFSWADADLDSKAAFDENKLSLFEKSLCMEDIAYVDHKWLNHNLSSSNKKYKSEAEKIIKRMNKCLNSEKNPKFTRVMFQFCGDVNREIKEPKRHKDVIGLCNKVKEIGEKQQSEYEEELNLIKREREYQRMLRED